MHITSARSDSKTLRVVVLELQIKNRKGNRKILDQGSAQVNQNGCMVLPMPSVVPTALCPHIGRRSDCHFSETLSWYLLDRRLRGHMSQR